MITPKIGHLYCVKHSSGIIRARFLRLAVYNPTFNPNSYRRDRRSTTHYIFENLSSGREIVVKSRVKIRHEIQAGE